MNSQIFDKIGDWNPQLFRELKGRLTNRNLILTLLVSLLVQGLLFWAHDSYRNAHGVSSLGFFYNLTLGMPIVLMTSGAYFLGTDLSQELQRGTINFLRLSPQSSFSILLGKILGVPIISYLGIISFLPLYLCEGLSRGIPFSFFLSYYLITGISCYFLFSLISLWAFVFGASHQTGKTTQSPFGAASALIALLFAIFFEVINVQTTWSQSIYPESNSIVEWFYLPISQNFLISHIFILSTLGLGINAVWFGLKRCFYDPNATTLSKSRSYLLVPLIEILALGFFVREGILQKDVFTDGLRIIFLINFAVFLAQIAILTPHRQTLLDWCRYRHITRSSLVQDLLWADRSPALLAIAINFGICFMILCPWLIYSSVNMSKIDDSAIRLILGMICFGVIILIYGAIAQLVLFMKTPKRQIWAVGIIGTLIFLSPVPQFLLGVDTSNSQFLWMIIGSPWMVLYGMPLAQVFGAIAAHSVILFILSNFLKQKLVKAGESEFKAMQV